ncbi:MAG: hypothetical protein EPO21_24025 [Chloroflexota bacterium]|nr:MAG: hypothetical protein EPO21_24025 [Chloroflexota bacterium]
MSLLEDLKMYVRFTAGLRGYLKHQMTLEEAQRIVRDRMEHREENFLRLLRRGVYGYARSPYLGLLRHAGCELADVERMVRTQGLETTLRSLRQAGVYVSFDEFKGRAPLERNGQLLATTAQDFDNPSLARHFYAETGGSTGKASRIVHDLDHYAATAPHHMLTWAAHGVLDAPMAVWRGILPDGSGINNVLRPARFGHLPEQWFSPIPWWDSRRSLKYSAATCYLIILARLMGTPIPWSRYVPLQRADIVASWVATTVKAQGKCFLAVTVSRALRVALAAEQAGLNLSGAVFKIAGEPPTPAKVRAIERSGVRCYPDYGMSEAGRIGMGCVHPRDCTDVHLLKDAFALMTYPQVVPGHETTVPAFNLTTLLPTTPKIMLNVVSDDYGIVEERRCGCALETFGFTTHLRQIFSSSKLTGEGVTLVGSEMVGIIEETLPARFGGSPLDYQWLEEEDEHGFTRLYIVISPRVTIADEHAAIETVLEALSRSSNGANAARMIWKQAGTLKVRRDEPVWTARGKLMPLHLQRYAANATSER